MAGTVVLKKLHFQRAYETERILKLLDEAGFQTEKLLDADTKEAAGSQTERIFVAARKKESRR